MLSKVTLCHLYHGDMKAGGGQTRHCTKPTGCAGWIMPCAPHTMIPEFCTLDCNPLP